MPPIARVLTEEEKVQVEALASVLTSEQIADYLEISRSTFYDRRERDPDLEKSGQRSCFRPAVPSLPQRFQKQQVYVHERKRWDSSRDYRFGR